MSLLCRKSITPSQQVEEESARFLGISHNSPYLCIRFKIHTLEVSFLFHIAFVLGYLLVYAYKARRDAGLVCYKHDIST